MNKAALLGFLLLCSGANAQVWNLNMLVDSVSITGPYSDTREIVVSNRQARYSPEVRKFGLHFRNGLENTMSNTVRIANLFGSPILGAHGAGTVVRYAGKFSSDGGQSLPSLCVLNGGKIVLEESANVDLILPGSFFTRQFWCLGDGTGTVEFAEGFRADRTLQGQVDSGLGSIRFSNCRFVTHHTESLPMGYRPNPALINSHLVFENEAGSRWITQTNPQSYRGGLWVRKSMTVETQTDLELNGVRSVWPDYTNYGGIFLEDSNLTIRKEGPARLILSGEQGYDRGSALVVSEGEVVFRTSAFNPADSAFHMGSNRRTGRNLAIRLEGKGRLRSEAGPNRIRSLTCSDSSTTTFLAGRTLESFRLNLAGTARLEFPSGFVAQVGDSFALWRCDSVVGRFHRLFLPETDQFLWDTTQLYARGVVKISGLVGLKKIFRKGEEWSIFPNPGQNQFHLEAENLPSPPMSIHFFSETGKEVHAIPSVGEQRSWQLPQTLPPGIFWLEIRLKNGSRTGKWWIRE